MNIYCWQLKLKWRYRDLCASVLVAAQSLDDARQAAVDECPHYLTTLDVPLEDVPRLQEDVRLQVLEGLPRVQNDKATYVFYVHGTLQLSWSDSAGQSSSKMVC